MAQIKLDKLSKIYTKDIGIKDVDLEINEKEIYGFIGPNGAGKSTTIRTILALLKPTGGSSSICGLDSQKDYDQILEHVGYLPSELFYYSGIKAIDLLKYSEKFYKKDCSSKRNELAKILNIDLNQKIDDLSYGSKKKVGIIDALQHEPTVLILDEPTGGLDPLVQNKFFEVLEQYRDNGTTIFFSSHILSEVQRICDRVAIIKEGRIIDIQDIAELKKDNYKSISITSNDEIVIDIDGTSNIKKTTNGVEFLYHGEINTLIQLISRYNIIDVKIDEPDLEEVFIHYYE